MHIKKLTIHGFKSYRDAVVVDPFSEKVNIVVGRNGAGKSNFFSAIRFVLSDAYTRVDRAERQSLLHEGSDLTNTYSAYVEIVFDNSDGRVPTGKSETILRRTIGAKKDDYTLDRKSTNKGEVMSLLESAGFSKSNPFFIVPQGRVTALTNQKDPERLELLKEIAGTRVYEDKRAESVRIMEETDQKRAKIDEALAGIDERLAELEEEKEELKQYREADRSRRCLAYAINQHDLEEATAALDAVESARQHEAGMEDQRQKAAQERQKNISTIESRIAELEEEIGNLQLEREQLEIEKTDAVKARTQINLTIRDLEESKKRTRGQQTELQQDLDAINETIESTQEQLEKLEPDYAKAVAEEAAAKASLDESEAKQSALFAKQGRSAQFRTQAERDTYLRKDIAKNKAYLQGREQASQRAKRDLQDAKDTLAQSTTELAESQQKLESLKTQHTDIMAQLDEVNHRYHEKDEQRKEIWKEESKLDRAVTTAKEAIRTAEDTLYKTMDRSTREGLQAIARTASSLNLSGVHGPLYQLFDTPDMFRTAVEVTAGNSLFHVVVDTDQTAQRIVEVLTRDRAGRVTFMPLNRLKPKPVQYPDAEESGAHPLVERLQYDAMFDAAIKQVFSRTVVVHDLQDGARVSRLHGLTAITLQGDKVEKKGSMTGGYHAPESSRLKSAQALIGLTNRYDTDLARQQQHKQNKRTLDQEISKIVGERTILEKRRDTTRSQREPLVGEIEALQRDIDGAKSRIDRLVKQVQDLEGEMNGLNISIDATSAELKTTMQDALSEEDNDLLNSLTTSVQQKKQELAQITRDRLNLASKKDNLEITLSTKLFKQRANIMTKLDAVAEEAGGTSSQQAASSSSSLTAKKVELASLDRSIAELEKKLDSTDGDIEQARADITTQRNELETEQGHVAEEARTLAKQQRHLERNLGKRQLLIAKKDELNRKIRDLGVVPDEAYTLHAKRKSVETLLKSHQKALEILRKFTTVNKRAFDQYDEFTTQRTELTSRRAELDTSGESIEELIEVLDQRKDEAIQRTFKQVSRNFAEVFEKLVPAGRGRLIMQTRAGDEGEEEEQADEEEEEAANEEDEEEDENDEDQEDEDDDEEDEDSRPTRKRRKPNGSAAANGRASKSKSKATGRGKAKSKKASKAPVIAKKKKSIIDSYTGVAIKVSFNSKSDEGLRIQQLSGGQKSLVALAMIFSIQKCDPAPFYLFDEIDANLDADRRTAVANMIRELSDDAQFIITTFRPELLTTADAYFGVVFDARKISSIKTITMDDAYEFVESNEGRR